MKDAALMLFGAFVLLAPAAFFWINSRDRKAAEKKWQRLDQALAACEIASHAAHEETPSAARIDADDRKTVSRNEGWIYGHC